MATGSSTTWTEVFNGGWWDPGGYWYTDSAAHWVAEFALAVPAGEALSKLTLAVDDGDLSGGMSHRLELADGTPLVTSAVTGQHGPNEYGGAASIGLHDVVTWDALGDASKYLRTTVVRYRCIPNGAGQHYLFNGPGYRRAQVAWTSALTPTLEMLL